MATIGNVTTNLSNTQSTVQVNTPGFPGIHGTNNTAIGILNNVYVTPETNRGGKPIVNPDATTNFGPSFVIPSGLLIAPIVKNTPALVNQIVVPISNVRVQPQANMAVTLLPSPGVVTPISGNKIQPIANATSVLPL